jgi:hypothetical protein
MPGVTVAVKVTGWLTDELEGAETTAVVVAVGLTISLRIGETPDWKFVSELV